MKPTPILVADDHELVRRGIRDLLSGSTQFQICGEAATGRDAVTATQALRPQIVVMDISMPELNGLEATRQILKVRPETQVLILTMHDTEQLVREVLESGARGYMLKGDAGRDLVAALEALAKHQPYFTSKVGELVLKGYLSPLKTDMSDSVRNTLSAREREILQLVAEGLSSKEIGGRLNITLKTAEAHRGSIMRKIGAHSVSELVRYAIRNGVIDA